MPTKCNLDCVVLFKPRVSVSRVRYEPRGRLLTYNLYFLCHIIIQNILFFKFISRCSVAGVLTIVKGTVILHYDNCTLLNVITIAFSFLHLKKCIILKFSFLPSCCINPQIAFKEN